VDASALGVWSYAVREDRVRADSKFHPSVELTYAEALSPVHPDDRQLVDRTVQQAIRTGRDYEVEYRMLLRDGNMRWISSRGKCAYDKTGAPLRLDGISLDITERKRAEEDRMLLASVVESSHDAILSLDLDFRITSWNPAAERLFGYRPTEAIGQPVWLLVPPDLREQTAAILQRVRAGEPAAWETDRFRKDGTRVHVSISSAPITSPAGGIVGVSSVSRDITERKQADEALKESERKYRDLYESLRDGFVLVGMDGRIRQFNEAFRAMTGYTAEELSTMTYFALTPAKWHALERTIIEEQVIPRGHSELYEKEYRRKDGTVFPVELRRLLLRDEIGGDYALWAIVRDITDRRRAEVEAERLRRDLAHISRVTMMGELTGSLAHELNQPLTAIASNAFAGERYLAGVQPRLDEVREILQDIAADARRAGEVIHRTRSLLKKDPGRFRLLDLNEVIRETVALTHTDAIIRHQPIDLDLAADLPAVMGDRIQIQQVLLNLVLNGMDAMAAKAAAERRLSVQTSREENALRVGVHDHGPGIPADHLEQIFATFFTTKPHGMGMGLAISRSIVEAHGGKIWAENNPEGGATFWFTLPVRSQRPPDAGATAGPPHVDDEKILVQDSGPPSRS
jgi:two-component system sensor kinase FixL